MVPHAAARSSLDDGTGLPARGPRRSSAIAFATTAPSQPVSRNHVGLLRREPGRQGTGIARGRLAGSDGGGGQGMVDDVACLILLLVRGFLALEVFREVRAVIPHMQPSDEAGRLSAQFAPNSPSTAELSGGAEHGSHRPTLAATGQAYSRNTARPSCRSCGGAPLRRTALSGGMGEIKCYDQRASCACKCCIPARTCSREPMTT